MDFGQYSNFKIDNNHKARTVVDLINELKHKKKEEKKNTLYVTAAAASGLAFIAFVISL